MNKLTPAQQAWVDALRSGDYRQGRSYLQDDQGRFCCLGVACEVARQHGVEVEVERSEHSHMVYDGSSAYPPKQVKEWLGLVDAGGRFNRGTVEDCPTNTLYGLNDNWGWTFDQIADAIERAQGLFVETPEEPTTPQRLAGAEVVKPWPYPKPESEIEF